MIEGNRENQGHDKEQDQDVFIVRANYQKEKETDQQNEDFRGDDVGENGAHKEAVFSFEKGHAVRAVVPDVERLVNYSRLATRRTTESHRATQDLLDLF